MILRYFCGGYNNHVSGITYRQRYEQKIREVNEILRQHSSEYGYNFIHNNNITARHIWRDKVHLSDEGSKVLCNNFILSLNSEQSERA